MGLDQCLYKRTWISNGDWVKEEHREDVTVTKGGAPHDKIKPKNIKYVVEEIGYWRKANAIHRWFVDNVQNGVDNCEDYRVKIDQLEDLLKTCKEVKKNIEKGEDLLPTQGGFFFGGTEYDSDYIHDIDNTIAIIEDLYVTDSEGNTRLDDGDGIYYSSSW